MGANTPERAVQADLLAAGLRPATRLRTGWETAPHGQDIVVFWACLGASHLPPRTTRLAGLGAVLDALTGRYQLALHGASHLDGAPVCVRVSAQSAHARQMSEMTTTKA